MTGEVKRRSEGPVAIKTILGWVLNGTSQSQSSSQTSVNLCDSHVLKISAIEQKSICNDKFTRFWEIENSNRKENFSVSEFTQKVEFNGQRYETPLHWKTDHVLLLDTFLLAKNRVVSLLKRLKKDPVILKTYDNIIKSEETKGITEESPGEVYYLPHHPIIRPEKSTTKLGIVYDASSSIEGPSLNQCLETGPNLLPKLIDILIRFRSYKVALISDIKQEFFNVSVKESDCDFFTIFMG